MDKERENIIKEYADELCKQRGSVHPTLIRQRNENIIEELVEKFDITYEYANICFYNNKERYQ